MFAKPHPKAPVETTLCVIAKNPARYSGKLVSFNARYDMVGPDGTTLADDRCYAEGIVPDITEGTTGEGPLRFAYTRGNLGIGDKTITATWIGIFRKYLSQIWDLVLDVREIRNVKTSYEGSPEHYTSDDVLREIRLPDPPLQPVPPKPAATVKPALNR